MTAVTTTALPLTASRSLLVGEIFRLPIAPAGSGVDGWEGINGRGGSLIWPGAALLAAKGSRPALHRLGDLPLFARVLTDDAVSEFCGSAWERCEAVRTWSGEISGSVWRSAAGAVVLPFDPDEAIRSCWSEAYRQETSHWLRAAAMRSYYRARPLLPRRAQIAMRRIFARVQRRSQFPAWPLETALHDLYDLVLATLADIAAEPLPYLAPWPRGHSWALVLTHDVETERGLEWLGLLRDIELERGYRSSWNFVPARYDVPDTTVSALRESGFEIGVHGLYHDGRDLESLETLEARLPGMREAAARWAAVGFRSPATHRRWEWMPRLGFDYDSSYPDTDPYEPQPGGCCSWFPFFNDDLVELPITLPQDHTLFVILRHRDATAWVEKARAIKDRGGMAVMNTHPDYQLEPSHRDSYCAFLDAFADDESAWKALPAEVSSWWRRRAASWLEPTGSGWRIRGPAHDDGVVATFPPSGATDQLCTFGQRNRDEALPRMAS